MHTAMRAGQQITRLTALIPDQRTACAATQGIRVQYTKYIYALYSTKVFHTLVNNKLIELMLVVPYGCPDPHE